MSATMQKHDQKNYLNNFFRFGLMPDGLVCINRQRGSRELDEEAMDSVAGGKFITVFGGFFFSRWWQSVKEMNNILNRNKGGL